MTDVSMMVGYKSFKQDLNYEKIVECVSRYKAALKRNNSL